jgi:hypothetical protein
MLTRQEYKGKVKNIRKYSCRIRIRIRIKKIIPDPQHCTLYQERAVFGKMKMDPAKRAQTQNAGEV